MLSPKLTTILKSQKVIQQPNFVVDQDEEVDSGGIQTAVKPDYEEEQHNRF